MAQVEPDAVSVASALAILRQIFRPSSPTNERELFRGRGAQLASVVTSVEEIGQHAVVFGERGVGKTSLAYMASDIFKRTAPNTTVAVRIQCSADDTFSSAWQKLIPRLQSAVDALDGELVEVLQPLIDRVEDILDFENCSPDTVARAINLMASRVPLLIVLDEFDRIDDQGSTRLFADLVKLLADDFVPCTVIVVGVADDVDQLIQGHRSVERNLKQISMPRMTTDELAEIVDGGFETFRTRSGIDLECSEEAVNAIVRLSHGFPYYTHLLSNAMGTEAIVSGTSRITVGLVMNALYRAMDEASQQVKTSYTDAIAAARSDASFDLTILACALSRTDDLGFFRASDVAIPLSQLTGTKKTTANYLAHLNRFAGDPSWILETRGEGRMTRFRFHNPLMRPFVLMKGVEGGLLRLDEEGTAL